MKRLLGPRAVLAVAVLASYPLALAGCEAILGLGGETTALSESGADVARRDARAEARADVTHEPDAALPPTAAIAVASGWAESDWCVVTAAGDVLCWGNNESGELGDGTTAPRATPGKVVDLPPSREVTLGTATSCALTRSGGVYCWGYGADGELGDGSTTPYRAKPAPVRGLESGVTRVSSGYFATCAIQSGTLYCWGYGGNGLLGNGGTTDARIPTKVPGLEDGVTSVSVGGNNACAVRKGSAYCWGSTAGSPTAVAVGGFKGPVDQVSSGGNFVCGLTVRGAAQCFGLGSYGQLGNGQVGSSALAVQVVGLASGVRAISAGPDSVTAIKTDGTVVAWGYAAYGALGNGSTEPDSSAGGGVGGFSDVPVTVRGLSAKAVAVSTGQAPCVATDSGTVECWGMTAENSLTPVAVGGLFGQYVAVSTGGGLTGEFACGLWEGGLPLCWGGNQSGQLGIGTAATPLSTLPVELAGAGGTTEVSAAQGGDFACSVSSGVAYCWGDNTKGQLGTGTIGGEHPSATPVTGLSGSILSVASGAQSACAIVLSGDAGVADGGAPSGALYCWGDNSFGQLGIGSGSGASHPSAVPVVGLGSGVQAVSLGPTSACALVSDGGVLCWGNDLDGELGDGDPSRAQKDVPTSVVGLTGPASAISIGWFSACAVTSGGTVQCWGDNYAGELGANTPGTSSLVPVTVTTRAGPALSGATQVSVGSISACAVVSGGAQCWGTGPIGNDSAPTISFYHAEPVKGLAVGVAAVAVGDGFACAVASGGVECWGLNHSGALGDNGAIDELSAKPVPGFP